MNDDSDINQEATSKAEINSVKLNKIGLWEKWWICLFRWIGTFIC